MTAINGDKRTNHTNTESYVRATEGHQLTQRTIERNESESNARGHTGLGGLIRTTMNTTVAFPRTSFKIISPLEGSHKENEAHVGMDANRKREKERKK